MLFDASVQRFTGKGQETLPGHAREPSAHIAAPLIGAALAAIGDDIGLQRMVAGDCNCGIQCLELSDGTNLLLIDQIGLTE